METENENESDSVIEFPCVFPIKAMGLAKHDLYSVVYKIVQKHAPDLSEQALSKKPSSSGKYVSITVTINASSKNQLDAIYQELTSHEHIIMAL